MNLRSTITALLVSALAGVPAHADDFSHASTDTPIVVAPGESEFSTIDVPEAVQIADLDVSVVVAHGATDDLLVALLAPNGRWVELHNRTTRPGGIDTRYDDEGDIPDGPGRLADYDGLSAMGAWKLFVTNFSGSQTATFTSWELHFTQRRSFPSSDTPINIRDFQPFDSVIAVADVFCVSDLVVDLNVSHTAIGDLKIDLTSPAGTTMTLHNRIGGLADNLVVTYDDDTNPPEGPGRLTDFNGEFAVGQWKLSVSDELNGNTGRLNNWTLHFGGATCPPLAHDGSTVVPANFIGTATVGAESQMGLPLSVRIGTLPLHGNLWTMDGVCITTTPYYLPDGETQVQYKPAVGFQGSDSFRFRVADGILSKVATQTLFVPVETLTQEFAGGLPEDWLLDDLLPGSEDSWKSNSGYGLDNYTNGSGACVSIDVRDWDAGDFDVSLTSPAVRLGASSELTWTSNYQNVGQTATVEISTDGGATWAVLSTETPHGAVDSAPGADRMQSLAAFAGATAQIRFRYAGTVSCGNCTEYWQVDSVMVTGVPAGHRADFNRDGLKNTSDFLAFFGAFNAGEPRADHNTDCLLNTSDFLAFLNDFTSP